MPDTAATPKKDASIEQQIKECLAYAKSQGIRIVATYSDRAITGKTDRRATSSE